MPAPKTTTKDPLTPPAKGDAKEANAAPAATEGEKPTAEKTPKRSKFQLLYPDASKITVLAKENPKKEGSKSRVRFQHYYSEKVNTVGEFIAAGGTYGDIAYDIGRKFISVETPPEAPAATPADPKAA